MAQTGFTPIQLYSTSTAAAAPVAGNLTNSTLGSELAINITDGKLFYKDNANAVQVIGWKTVPTTAGGTGLTTYTAGDLSYYASGTALTKLAIGASGRWLGSSGTAPQWNAPAALTKTDDTNVTLTLGGSASTALLNAASLTLGWTGTLAVSRGGTGTGTAFTAGSVVFAGASGVYSQDNANLFWDDTNNRLGVGIATPTYSIQAYGTAPVIATGGTTYLGDASTIGASFILRSENTVSWTGTRDLVSFDSIGNGADHRTGSLSIKVKANPSDSTLSEYYRIDAIRGLQQWFVNNSEKVRLHNSGGVSIGNTTDPGAGSLIVQSEGRFGSGLAIGSLSDPNSTFLIGGAVLSSGAGTHFLKWSNVSGLVTYDTSSRLVKTNIEDSPYGLAEILKLKPRKYFRTDDQRIEHGLIADEVVEIMPEYVPMVPKSLLTKDDNDTELVPGGVNYERIVAPLINAIHELNAQIDALKLQIGK
jgi:hypothetical protein